MTAEHEHVWVLAGILNDPDGANAYACRSCDETLRVPHRDLFDGPPSPPRAAEGPHALPVVLIDQAELRRLRAAAASLERLEHEHRLLLERHDRLVLEIGASETVMTAALGLFAATQAADRRGSPMTPEVRAAGRKVRNAIVAVAGARGIPVTGSGS